MTIAAASLYLACCSMGENVTQAEVAEAAGVGEQSVRDCCKEIRNLMKPPLV
jgi:transcription initiation factor TFIIIB Brf1 subunit/transcription initiation factor TFIIB